MHDGEQGSFKKIRNENKPKLPDFIKRDTIEKLRKQQEQDRRDQAEYASVHGVPNAHDIVTRTRKRDAIRSRTRWRRSRWIGILCAESYARAPRIGANS